MLKNFESKGVLHTQIDRIKSQLTSGFVRNAAVIFLSLIYCYSIDLPRAQKRKQMEREIDGFDTLTIATVVLKILVETT